MNNKIKVPSELAYFLYLIVLSLAVAMTAAANLGLSMIVSPAYIIHMWLDNKEVLGTTIHLTFGQSEYLVQGILFIIFCVLVKKVKLVYFTSFLTGVIYGLFLDMWRVMIPLLNPSVTPPGSMGIIVRIILYALGTFMTSFSIACCFRSYNYPQVYDFFVKAVSAHFKIDRAKFKICFDFSLLTISIVLTLLLFRKFVGVGIGTIITTCVNGVLIAWFDSLLGKLCIIEPKFKKFASYFDLGD